jgi:hypothetical protein
MTSVDSLRLPALGPPKSRDTLLQEIFGVSKPAAASLQEHEACNGIPAGARENPAASRFLGI